MKQGGLMPVDLVPARIAVLSTHGYRAESISLAVAARTGCRTQAFTNLDIAALTEFEAILIEISPSLESALVWASQITTRHADAKVILLGLEESEENVVKLAE